VKGIGKVAFEAGFTHYDNPPPDVVDGIDDLEALRKSDGFRFANRLAAYVEVDGKGNIVGQGYTGGGRIGTTTVRVGPLAHTFRNYLMTDIRHEPEVLADRVRFVQTVGGRTGLPAPRHVRRKPFIQWRAPTVWTTLALTVYADGRSEYEVVGASLFPRHWIYDQSGKLVAKMGLADFKDWYRKAFGKHTPWGDEESPALVVAAESALERVLSTEIMRGGESPDIRELAAGDVIIRQGDEGTDVYLLLDGVIRVEHDGERLAEYGPGALLGVRAAVEGGTRTSTNVAVTHCRIAVVRADQLDRDALTEVGQGHRREEGSAR
jgi:hypothetical protein